MLGPISIQSNAWWIAVLLGLALLIPLTWFAWKTRQGLERGFRLGLTLRTIGILLLLACLVEPHWTTQRAVKGANIVTVVADNSQGMSVLDIGQNRSRGEKMIDRLMSPEATWQSKLAENFQLRSYRFDRDLRRIMDFSSLDFTGDRTQILNTLNQLKERFANLPLAGTILITDGNATDFDGNLPDLTGLPPIYPVILGNDGQLNDVSLAQVELRQTVFDDAPVSIRANVASSGSVPKQIEVSIQNLETISGELSNLPESKIISTRADSKPVNVTFNWRPIETGIQFYQLEANSDLQEGQDSESEATLLNNRRVVMVDRGQKEFRILYVSGRPNWEYKFLNRSLYDDPQLKMVGLLRVARREPKFEFKGRSGESSNPLYRGFGREEESERYDQPVLVRVNTRDEVELRGGFPKTAEELFAYDAIVIDDLEADFFTYQQLTLIRRFVSERGGGLLALGGADALDHGEYEKTPLATALPVYLDRGPEFAPGENLSWKLTREGWVEPWTRVRPLESDERSRLTAMPPFKVLNPLPGLKPGARVLAEVEDAQGKAFPSLVAQNFGSGRVACVTVGDLWRWGLKGESEQADLARFWRQLARWLVTDTPQQVEIQAKMEGSNTRLVVKARDKEYLPLDLGQARIKIRKVTAKKNQLESEEKPSFTEIDLHAEPVPNVSGQFEANFSSREAGAYRAEVEVTDLNGVVVGRAETGWVNDPATEEFARLQPNRSLMEEIAQKTGGRVLSWSELDDLGEELAKQPAPVMEAWSYPLWHNGWLFLAALGCFLGEWALRRKRGLA